MEQQEDNNSQALGQSGEQPSDLTGKRSASRILFVRDIPKDLEYRTVEEVFSAQHGFVTLRRLPHFTFVEFKDIESSSQALRNLQSYQFRTYDRPMTIDFDRDTRDDASRKRKEEFVDDRSDTKRRDERDRRGDRFHRDDYSRRGGDRFSEMLYPSRGIPYPTFGVPNFSQQSVSSSSMGTMIPQDCGTLYVTNLPKDVTERELNILFRFMPGFTRIRLVVRESKLPICFADFLDAQSAAYALQTLQGYRIDLRDPEGLHIEFDKHHRPFGKKSL